MQATPLGALNLLPCLLDVRSGTNGFFVLHFDCSLDVLLTVEISNGDKE